MTGTLIDTTSLITLAQPRHSYLSVNAKGAHHIVYSRDQSVLSGIEAVLISEDIVIDFPSYNRNLDKYPELAALSNVARFINKNDKSENECYEMCTDVIIPIMNRLGSLDDMISWHFNSSIYWEELSGKLSKLENGVLKALESKQKKNFYSTEAKTNLIRFLYYTICQDVYGLNLVLHPSKSAFLKGIEIRKYGEQDQLAKNIVDVFDKDITDKFRKKSKKWLGKNFLEMNMPLLMNFVRRNRSENHTLIEDLIRMREMEICKDFRIAINTLQHSITIHDKYAINDTLTAIEKLVGEINSGTSINLAKNVHRISISIPFIGGLGTEVSLKLPKFRKNDKEKILIFLQHLL